MKKCKYCMSSISENAKVCPYCRKAQSNENNPLLLIPILAIIFFFAWCVLSKNAPNSVRELLCEIGVRQGSYCLIETGEYEIKIKGLNE